MDYLTERVVSPEKYLRKVKNSDSERVAELTEETNKLKREIASLRETASKHEYSMLG